MYRIRRHDLSPRIELLPLIDVIFLLLTFFIYSLIVMVRVEILPVQLMQLSSSSPAEPTDVAAITIDAGGRYFLDRELIEPEALDEKLAEIVAAQPPPKLFLAIESVSISAAAETQRPVVDRGPILIRLIDQVRRAGIEDFVIVGQARADQPAGAD